MHQDYPFVTSQPSSYIHQHRARQPTCSSCIHQNTSKRIRLTLSSSSLFSSSFFVVFVVFIPRSDRGVVYMRVSEKIGVFGGFVAIGLRRFKHVWRRWFWRLWGEDSTISWWHPGMFVRIHHITKTRAACAGGELNKGHFLPLLLHALDMPQCSYRPRKCSLSGG